MEKRKRFPMKKIQLYTTTFIFVLFFGLSGSLSASNDQTPIDLETNHQKISSDGYQTDISFEPQVTFRESDDVIFGGISTAVVDQNGRVFMADNTQHRVHIFNPDGSYLRSLGQQGQGPGEFASVTNLLIDNKYLHVADHMQRRISVFDLSSLTFSHDLSLTPGQENTRSQTRGQGMMASGMATFPRQVNLFSDGNYLVTFTAMGGPGEGAQVVMAPDGKTIDTGRFEIKESGFLTSSRQGSSFGMFSIPDITPTTFISIPGTGKLFVNHSTKLEIQLFNEDGSLIRTFSKPYKHHELKREQVIARVEAGSGSERLMAAMQRVDLPEEWPAVNRMIADKQNRVWVSTNTEDHKLKNWIVFDEHGNQLAEFTWPSTKRVVHVQDNYLYTLEQDEFELPLVVKYTFKIG